MIQKAEAMGNWWLAASSGQTACSCITSHAEFLVKHQITQVSQPPYSPDLAPCDFWLFPKLKSPLKGRHFRLPVRFRKTWWGSWWWLRELCEVPRYLLWKGLRSYCLMYNVSGIFYLLQQMSLVFILPGWIPLGQTNIAAKCNTWILIGF